MYYDLLEQIINVAFKSGFRARYLGLIDQRSLERSIRRVTNVHCTYKLSLQYTVNAFLHRTDGPAIEWADGGKMWHKDGKRHRETGPAIVFASGRKEWYKDDKELTEEEFNKSFR